MRPRGAFIIPIVPNGGSQRARCEDGASLRSLAVASAARERAIPVIVGAQLRETSVLTRVALTIAHAAGTSLVAQEGAFGTFQREYDVCEPSLMFCAGGVRGVQAYPSLEGPA